MENELKERAKRLAEELTELLKENLPKNPNLTIRAMARVKAIQEEIRQMGIRVTWKTTMDSKTLVPEVEVTLWEPRKDLSPDEQKIYDRWFMGVNKIEPSQ